MQREQTDNIFSVDFLADLSRGKEGTFRVLYDAYKHLVFKSAHLYLQDEQEATEITQRVFIRLWEKRHLLVNVDKLQDYIFTITKNLVFDHLKHLGRQTSLMLQYRQQATNTTDHTAENLVTEKNIAALWLNIVNRLPTQQQQVYIMVEQQGLNLEEASAKLSLAKATVKKHLELARRYVRSELKSSLQDSSGSSIIYSCFLQIFL